MTSLRKRLIVPIVGGLFVLSAVSGVLFYLYARHTLVTHFDTALMAKARALATLVEQDEDKNFTMEFSDDNMPEFLSKESPRYFEVWLPRNSVLKRSENLEGLDLDKLNSQLDEPVTANVQLPGGVPGRAAGMTFFPLVEVSEARHVPQGNARIPATVVVARDRRELDQTLLFLFTFMITGAVLLPLVAAAIVVFAVKRSLRPVDELSLAMGRIESPLEGQRFESATMPAELQPIVLQLNNLMTRLRATFDRERRFTMDASHELRTPLAEARTALEVALKWPDDTELMASSCQLALESTKNMQYMIDAMLALARAEADSKSLEMELVDLEATVKACWSHLSSKADQRGLSLTMETKGVVWGVYVNPTLISSIITNLLDNAVEYSIPDSDIDITLCAHNSGNRPMLVITNSSAEDLSEDDVANMFQPLWRKEASRAAVASADNTERTHAGLGLALVESFCKVLNIELQAARPEPHLLRITLTFSEADQNEANL